MKDLLRYIRRSSGVCCRDNLNGTLSIMKESSGSKVDYYAFSGPIRDIWIKLKTKTSLEDLSSYIATKYNLDYEQSEEEVSKTLAKLLDNNLIFKGQ